MGYIIKSIRVGLRKSGPEFGTTVTFAPRDVIGRNDAPTSGEILMAAVGKSGPVFRTSGNYARRIQAPPQGKRFPPRLIVSIPPEILIVRGGAGAIRYRCDIGH